MSIQLWSTVIGGLLVLATTLLAGGLQHLRERERLNREETRDRDRLLRERFEQRRSEMLRMAAEFNEAARTMEGWARRDEVAKSRGEPNTEPDAGDLARFWNSYYLLTLVLGDETLQCLTEFQWKLRKSWDRELPDQVSVVDYLRSARDNYRDRLRIELNATD